VPAERPRLSFDIDGVLCRQPFGINPGTNRGKRRDGVPGFNPLWPFERWRYSFRRPMPYAVEDFHELNERYECVLVSARGSAAEEATLRWVERHFDTAPEVRLRPHPRESSAQYKARVVPELAPLAHFEDDPHTAEWLAELIPAVFVVDWPRNRWLEGPNIYRIGRLREAIPVLEELAAGRAGTG
jgi:hypothetical protein